MSLATDNNNEAKEIIISSSSSFDATLKGQLSDRVMKYSGTTVWGIFTPLAIENKAINLGQGFPGWAPPPFVMQQLSDVAIDIKQPGLEYMVHQYAPNRGHTRLLKAVCDDYNRKWKMELDWKSNVTVHNGCGQALATTMLGLINPGDEVIVLVPAFDLYYMQAELCGAVVKCVPLVEDESGKFVLDMAEFEAAFTDKTRMFILNTPHNPTGKVFTRDELTKISTIVMKHPKCIVMSDEVYDNIITDGYTHESIATIAGMFERTITVNSAGKTFSCTGWKIGYAVGPEYLVRASSISNQCLSFACNTPGQEAIARCIEIARQTYKFGRGIFDNYYVYLRNEYDRKRTLLITCLKEAGIKTVSPEGTFFVIGNISHIKLPEKYQKQLDNDNSMTFDYICCIYLTEVVKVCAIPLSAFYPVGLKHLGVKYARFAYCKEDAYILQGGKLLKETLNP